MHIFDLFNLPKVSVRNRRRILALLLLVAMTFALAAAQGWLDKTPPEVFVLQEGEDFAEGQLPAGQPLELLLSSSEPVTFEVTYGDTQLQEVGQNVDLALPVVSGEATLKITATDAADNSSTYSYTLFGLPELQPQVQVTDSVIPGDPVSVRVALPPESLGVEEVVISLNGEPLNVFYTENEAIALTSVPLGAEAAGEGLEVSLLDQYGREVTAERTLNVLSDPRPVQELSIPASALRSSTPENKELEAQAVAAAFNASLGGNPLWSEPFLLPIQGRGTSGYGTPRRYAPGGRVSYHHGADIAAPAGTPILATNDGVVLIADFYPIKGGLVVLDHGAGVYSLYFHQSAIDVSAGQEVARAQKIGEVGSTGLSTGPHLHWEMRVNTVSTDPLKWVGQVFP